MKTLNNCPTIPFCSFSTHVRRKIQILKINLITWRKFLLALIKSFPALTGSFKLYSNLSCLPFSSSLFKFIEFSCLTSSRFVLKITRLNFFTFTLLRSLKIVSSSCLSFYKQRPKRPILKRSSSHTLNFALNLFFLSVFHWLWKPFSVFSRITFFEFFILSTCFDVQKYEVIPQRTKYINEKPHHIHNYPSTKAVFIKSWGEFQNS